MSGLFFSFGVQVSVNIEGRGDLLMTEIFLNLFCRKPVVQQYASCRVPQFVVANLRQVILLRIRAKCWDMYTAYLLKSTYKVVAIFSELWYNIDTITYRRGTQ